MSHATQPFRNRDTLCHNCASFSSLDFATRPSMVQSNTIVCENKEAENADTLMVSFQLEKTRSIIWSRLIEIGSPIPWV